MEASRPFRPRRAVRSPDKIVTMRVMATSPEVVCDRGTCPTKAGLQDRPGGADGKSWIPAFAGHDGISGGMAPIRRLSNRDRYRKLCGSTSMPTRIDPAGFGAAAIQSVR